MVFGGLGGLLQMTTEKRKNQLAEPAMSRVLLVALMPDQLVMLTGTGKGQGTKHEWMILSQLPGDMTRRCQQAVGSFEQLHRGLEKWYPGKPAAAVS